MVKNHSIDKWWTVPVVIKSSISILCLRCMLLRALIVNVLYSLMIDFLCMWVADGLTIVATKYKCFVLILSLYPIVKETSHHGDTGACLQRLVCKQSVLKANTWNTLLSYLVKEIHKQTFKRYFNKIFFQKIVKRRIKELFPLIFCTNCCWLEKYVSIYESEDHGWDLMYSVCCQSNIFTCK